MYNDMLPASGLSCTVLDAHNWQIRWLTASSSSSHGSTAGSSQLDTSVLLLATDGAVP